MSEVAIQDLEPLQTLNTYRRGLGLGPSRNLISSVISTYDPNTIAKLYEEITMGDPSKFSLAYSPAQYPMHGTHPAFDRPPTQSPTRGHDKFHLSPSSQYQSSRDRSSETRSSSSHRSVVAMVVAPMPSQASRPTQARSPRKKR
ncbi:hypothetical protein NUW58_g3585 [Xylaria curta]|uniref:Uncharacterized protein n=1 Tax=Xylaria curta TaxID=42375 RepID=A0ACC1PAD2_9PEZI|nr:hypothetical protein NUW58_g3585 [Xylaria curta]